MKRTQLPDRTVHYSACSFMKCLYVFGGYDGCSRHSLRSCLKYYTETSDWNFVTKMNSYRQLSSCTVFEGKILVTGGYDDSTLKSVESYDHYENKWTHLPDMIEKRYNHGAVSMGNKMFVIGGFEKLTCEVFDSNFRKFTSVKQLLGLNNLGYYDTSVVSIGYKVLFFYSTSSNVNKKFQVYDVLKYQWCLKEEDFIEDKRYISCSKLPIV